ncbi:SEC-C domain-containing protein [Nissabacter archeti]|uniref:SEC-C domain-containing protein n=1 Tax=Nissabacter archeti TaxID=1917880 RepID=A0ABS5JEA4_9GAMM|nr:SEC-C domain-containing protein [Nissabacter archeti]MBS0968161.1 SEC-C domain-containing protein [Nissabacter archeti]
MMFAESKKKFAESGVKLLEEMEALACEMRTLIASMPPEDLIGYIYAQFMMHAAFDNQHKNTPETKDLVNDNQFLLEYVHAVLATDIAPKEMSFDEKKCSYLFSLSRDLCHKAMLYAIASSLEAKDSIFGPDTSTIEFHSKTAWVMLRGNRYQVLEEEFYRYVLSPHDDVLKEVYGVSGGDIARGIQSMANAIRTGHTNALEEMMMQFIAVQEIASQQKKTIEEVMESWKEENGEKLKFASQAASDVFRGGITNVSLHTDLPDKLLADLAYQRGEDTDFFAIGDFSGTPYRTLPARKKPLIKLDAGYYAVDPCFMRDAGYRALLHNLLQRKPEYKKEFEERQKTMSEGAFYDILRAQFPTANVYQEIYYKDPETNQWSENDMLILMDDVLFLIEAKAGAAATIASPATDFKRHAQSVQDLVIKAYKQCERFFNYLNSADEVIIYQLVNGKHKECGRIKASNYRVMLPIGLTVESFSPFSSFCKQLPQIKPLLDKYGFVSMSIDDLFVLKRFLPSPGAFLHYMEVRQLLVNVRNAFLYDEFDHLGLYITNNRFDLDSIEKLAKEKGSMLLWDGMSSVIDKSFEELDWDTKPLPTQDFPKEVTDLLEALDSTRAPGWLAIDSHIRNYDAQTRSTLGNMLKKLGDSLDKHPARYFLIGNDEESLFIWMQNFENEIDWGKVNDKASSMALNIKDAVRHNFVIVEVDSEGKYIKALGINVIVPQEKTDENAHIFEDAERLMNSSGTDSNFIMSSIKVEEFRKVGRNEACPCGSGIKYKKCHGR